MGFYQLERTQFIQASIDEVWDFISSPKNLEKITPPDMGFDIVSPKALENMYSGMIISYKVSPFLNIKTTWVTEITHVRHKEYFVDEQRVGPFAMWHHQHLIYPQDGGVIMKDIVSYKPPFGILGDLAHWLFIKKRLKQIFDHRVKAVDQYFFSNGRA